jgi:hypothetical protein|nr:MAG TPA_asm: pectinesterase [Caudoviricetes sp.]
MPNYVDKFGLFGEEILVKDTETSNALSNYKKSNDINVNKLLSDVSTLESSMTNLTNRMVSAEYNITNIKNNYMTIPVSNRNIFIVDYKGNGDFTTITNCLNYIYSRSDIKTSGDDNYPNNCTILIMQGSYQEDIDLSNRSGITFTGIGEVSIVAKTTALNGAVYITGFVIFNNIRFFNNLTNGYAVHYEGGGHTHSSDSAKYHETQFNNCIMFAERNAGLGIGCSNDHTRLRFNGCEFRGYTGRDVYLHNSVYTGVDNIIIFQNCLAFQSGVVEIDDSANFSGNVNKLSLIIIGCSFMKMNFRRIESRTNHYVDDNTNITISQLSGGNTGVAFNYKTYQGYTVVCYKNYNFTTGSSSSDTYYTSIEFPDSQMYDVKLINVTIVSNNQDITSSCQIVNSQNAVNIAVPQTIASGSDLLAVSVVGYPK